MGKWINLIRSIPRPAMAMVTVGGTFILLVAKIEIPDAWWGIVGTCATFYFVQRSSEKKA